MEGDDVFQIQAGEGSPRLFLAPRRIVSYKIAHQQLDKCFIKMLLIFCTTKMCFSVEGSKTQTYQEIKHFYYKIKKMLKEFS
jgi:hypothetical protein